MPFFILSFNVDRDTYLSSLQADIDNSGTIDYGEFLAATVHLNKLEREENLLSAFSFFDKDGSGFITIDELQQACKEFGLNDFHLDEMIKEVDQDNVCNNQFLFVFFFYQKCMCLLHLKGISNHFKC